MRSTVSYEECSTISTVPFEMCSAQKSENKGSKPAAVMDGWMDFGC